LNEVGQGRIREDCPVGESGAGERLESEILANSLLAGWIERSDLETAREG